MYGVVGTGALSVGDDLYDLISHFARRTYAFGDGIEGAPDSTYSLSVDWNRLLQITERTMCLQTVDAVGEPLYLVSLFAEGEEIVLAHGWEDVSYHEDRRWQLGEKSQITYSLGEPGSCVHCEGLGVRETLTSVNDIRLAAEKRLQQVFGRLADACYSTLLVLEWEDVAALFCHIRDSWMEVRPHLRSLPGGYMRVEVRGRYAPLELQLSNVAGQQVAALRAEHTPDGWRLSETHSGFPNDCSWHGSLVFKGNHRSPWGRDQCPHPERHKLLHEEAREPMHPWMLRSYIENNWTNRLCGDEE